MPTRKPRQKAHYDDEDDDSTPLDQKPIKTLSTLIMSRVDLSGAQGAAYNDEDKKRAVITQLVRLKEERKTDRECASLLSISESCVYNYKVDPMYREIQSDLITDAKERGHVRIAEVIDDAVDVLYALMTREAKSDFVRMKSAEALLTFAGFAIPRDQQQSDSKAELNRFMAEIDARQNKSQVNVTVYNTSQQGEHPAGSVIVESDGVRVPEGSIMNDIPDDLRKYYQPLLDGGKLPEGFE